MRKARYSQLYHQRVASRDQLKHSFKFVPVVLNSLNDVVDGVKLFAYQTLVILIVKWVFIEADSYAFQ